MSASARRRNRPLYPALAAALALASSSCGPLEEELARLQPLIPADAGSVSLQPTPPDFIGGDAAFEILPDGGVLQ